MSSLEDDNLGPRVLKELADDIAPILLLIYHRSLASGEVPADWCTVKLMLHLLSRRDRNTLLRTIDQSH